MSTHSDNSRKILSIFEHFQAEPGYVLLANNFVSVGARRRWEMRDLQAGLELAADKGWIEKADLGWKLTDSGFSEMRELHASQ